MPSPAPAAYANRFGTGYVDWLTTLGTGSYGISPPGHSGWHALHASNLTGGFNRSINPTAGIATSAATPAPGVEWSPASTNLPGGASVIKLAYAAGSNIIYGIDMALLPTVMMFILTSMSTAIR